MRAAVVVFPGTNCEHDVAHALRGLGAEVDLVFHKETSLDGYDGVVLPGGFAHGDYLRTGAIARFSPIMDAVEEAAAAGLPVLGICNGFQILCEAELLPGALLPNRDQRFICRPVDLTVRSTRSVLTAGTTEGDVVRLPLNSYEGRYVASQGVLDELESHERVVLTYEEPNPNGSARGIAGICSERGNVVGLMPHPERASEDALGSADGRKLLESFTLSMARV